MPTINFFLQTEKNPAGIYVRLRDGKAIDCKAKTKFAVNPAHWDTGFRKVKGQLVKQQEQGITAAFKKDAEGKKLFSKLVKFEAELLSHYNNSSSKADITSQWLKDFITPPEKPEGVPDKLIPYFEYYKTHKKSDLRSSTYTKISGVKSMVERFEKYCKTQFLIKDVNANFKIKFVEFCEKENYHISTVDRAIRLIKTVCYHARRNDVETSKQLDEIVIKYDDEVKKIILYPADLSKIEAAKLEHGYQDNARDWLLISCETGQRVSDLLRFNKEMLTYLPGKSGDLKPFVQFTQVKTGQLMQIPLSKKVVEILNKRAGEFPRKISDQKYNLYIKEVCKAAELTQNIEGSKQDPETLRKISGTFEKWELVTSHIGRRSFATNNYGLKPTPVLMYMTGHKSEAQFLEYIGKTPAEAAMQAAEYF